MIIGISGKIGSGKDTIGYLIKGLTNDALTDGEVLEYVEEDKLHLLHSDWETKKFAGKLKQITALLLGCTVEDLEDREFKETPLGEEWNKTVYHIRSEHNILETFFTKEQAEQYLSHWEDNYSQPVYVEQDDVFDVTPRFILQILGTEAGRNVIHPDIWVNATMADYKEDTGFKYPVKFSGRIPKEGVELEVQGDPIPYNNGYPKWIMTDCRFPNEAQAVLERNGIVIRVEREGLEESLHPSETALDNFEGWDYVIQNNGSIEELLEKVKEILIENNLL